MNSIYQIQPIVENLGLPWVAPARSANIRRPKILGSEITNETLVSLVCMIVGASFNADPQELRSKNRGSAETARARQVAMYLLHTGLSIKLCDIADTFSRDRTTIAYACRQIEDLRDIPIFDRHITSCEEIIKLIRLLLDGKNAT